MRTTVAHCRDPELSSIPEVLQLCDDNADILYGYLNQATRRLLPKGQWKGTVVRYRFCSTGSECITWPRHVEVPLAFAVCEWPGRIRSHWYEFMGYGPGQIFAGNTHCGASKLIDRGMACAFDDICGSNKKIRVYLDNPNDAGKTILIQGYDQYRNWVLTNNGETNGELVTLQANPATYVDTSTVWASGPIAGIIKEPTLGNVRLFELDTVTALQRPLAIYEPDETNPQYRRSFVPGLGGEFRCCSPNGDNDCTQKTVTALVKLGFIPVSQDTDYLLIQNLDAMQDMVQSILKRKANLWDDARKYEASAVQLLEDELANWHGDGTLDPMQVQNSGIFGMAGVRSMI